MLTARRFEITGRVQGVGFRFFARKVASAEGLRGWVRNLPDGTVEAFVEGDRESVERFEARVRRGPAGARVQQVNVYDEVPGGSTRFEIR